MHWQVKTGRERACLYDEFLLPSTFRLSSKVSHALVKVPRSWRSGLGRFECVIQFKVMNVCMYVPVCVFVISMVHIMSIILVYTKRNSYFTL